MKLTKKIIIGLYTFFACVISIYSQTKVSGTIIDKNNNDPIVGANIYIKDTYDGASSDANGKYSLTTSQKGEVILIASFIGYEQFETKLNLNEQPINLDIEIEELSSTLNTVTITAGAYEASDRKKGTVLKPIDIITTSTTLGDVYGAINALPGTTKNPDRGELFVRGGESYETRTFIDGLLIQKPYSSSMPDVPSRGRFSPMLFGGTLFSTGGYSAEYGQAMSSALILNTKNMPPEEFTSISLQSVGLGLSHVKKFKNSSINIGGGYKNLLPYYSLIKQKREWIKKPEIIDGNINYIIKTGNKGLLKVLGSYSQIKSTLNYPDFDNYPQNFEIDLKSQSGYLNSVYQYELSDKWSVFTGVCYSNDKEKFGLGDDNVDNKINSYEFKYKMEYTPINSIIIKFGGNLMSRDYYQNYFSHGLNQNYISEFNDNLVVGFVEPEFKIGRNIAARIGLRAEQSLLLNKSNYSPRVSLAYKLFKNGQFSFGYGWFYQTPQDDILRFTDIVDFEKAEHYILNYQIMKNDRVFRVEAYLKKYSNLIKFVSPDLTNSEAYDNSGAGYAKGVDIFWRDKKTIPLLDYWISYSFVDSERKYRDYTDYAEPTFVANHNFTSIFKYYITKISSQVGLSYSFASGRTYYNPNNVDFLEDKTKPYNDLSANISYLTTIKDNFTILFVSVSNVLGLENVFGYHYASTPQADGSYSSYRIESPAKRFYFIGVFISLK